jgi:Peptidoglycan-binding protein, CsiV
MKVNLTTARLSVLALSTMLAPESVFAASKKIDQRWFEVEVILFSQLGDKKELKERFDERATLPNYQTIDLLKSYLQPDLSVIKAQLPQCEDRQYPQNFIVQSAQPVPFFKPQTLESIDTNTEIDWPTEPKLEAEHVSELDRLEKAENTEEQRNSKVSLLTDNDASSDTEATLTNETFNNNSNADDEPIGLTPEQVELVAQAQEKFLPIEFTYQYAQVPWFRYGENNKQLTLCRLADQNQSNDAFPIDSLSGRINNPEFIYTDNPYLISSDSLQLKDIYLQLRRSKDFRPLLHLGWRQSLINRKPAEQNKALKIYAGDHFEQQYVEALREVERIKEETQFEQWLVKQTAPENSEGLTDTPVTGEPAETLSPLKAKLNYIFTHIEEPTTDKDQLIAQIDDPKIFDTLITQDSLDEKTSVVLSTEQPIKPVQPWYLDGLFRLHLSHYLYITADFNISNLTASELATAKLTGSDNLNWQSIPFSQNRRVISGEVHYFDHPYMGMVVQIRRYEKPEPKDETLNIDNE